ncbi:MAG TPA: YraN family protein [Candidatus Choladousia intestinigallinarum]|nr:YraN family protein [Candidatus Choladousia intestinigallinarum]
MNRRSLGTEYEQRAAQWLEQRGYEIREKNFRGGGAEVDLIAEEGGYLVFVEVKYRKDAQKGWGMEAVDSRKQQRIIRAARVYLARHYTYQDIPCRFDVVSFCGEEITLVKNAFEVS